MNLNVYTSSPLLKRQFIGLDPCHHLQCQKREEQRSDSTLNVCRVALAIFPREGLGRFVIFTWKRSMSPFCWQNVRLPLIAIALPRVSRTSSLHHRDARGSLYSKLHHAIWKPVSLCSHCLFYYFLLFFFFITSPLFVHLELFFPLLTLIFCQGNCFVALFSCMPLAFGNIR